MNEMKWENLKKNKCPKCGKDWATDLIEVYGILTHGCGFRIRSKRYKEIVSNMVTKNMDDWFDKQERNRGER